MNLNYRAFTNRDVVFATPGRHHTGTQGLYLWVSPDAQIRRWIYRYTSPVTHRVTETGFGPVTVLTLAQARAKALELQRQIAQGICPITARRAAVAAQTTFGEACDSWIETHKPGWRSGSQLRNCNILLNGHGKALRKVPVASVTPDLIESTLADLWVKRPAQARRALAMFERVLDYAKAKGLRVGDNPASWRGMHEYRFPRRQKTDRKHYAAMPYTQISSFMKSLRQKQSRSSAAMALEFLILTAARSGEVLGMTWDEIDWDQKLWTMPATRTKQGREHVVPLSGRAMELLKLEQQWSPGSEFVFTGYKRSRLAEKAMVWVLKSMNREVTVHGFRSTFRDWAGDTTSFAREHIEECLAHAVGNGVERAYRRQNGLDKRRVIMEAWAEYCSRQ
jgi:integrase